MYFSHVIDTTSSFGVDDITSFSREADFCNNATRPIDEIFVDVQQNGDNDALYYTTDFYPITSERSYFSNTQDLADSPMLDFVPQPQQYAARPDFYLSGSLNGVWPTQESYGSSALESISSAQSSPFLNKQQQQLHNHHRALSTSTSASQYSNSPGQPAPLYASNLLDPHQPRSWQNYHHHYPTPSHTPVAMDRRTGGERSHSNNSMMAANTSAPTQVLHMQQQQPNQVQPQQQQQQQEVQRQSQRTMTPTSQYGPYSADQQESAASLSRAPSSHPIPRFEHSMTQACGDELYNPSVIIPQPQYPPKPIGQNYLQPNQVQQRIEEAHQARSKSPREDSRRETSPYIPGSVEDPASYGQVDGIRTAQGQRLSAKWHDDQYQHWRHHTRGVEAVRQQPNNTISPKDAYVDNFHAPSEDSAASASALFPDTAGSSQQLFEDSAVNTGSFRGGYGMINEQPRFPSAAFTFQAPQTLAVSGSAEVAPAVSTTSDFKLPTMQHSNSSSSEPPAHLISMETSRSEPESSQESASLPPPRPQHRPSAAPNGNASSSAESGTYSCTYNGCPRRFPTAVALQAHKRSDHRQTVVAGGPPTTAARVMEGQSPHTTSNSRSASPSALDDRNSQAGPHRCDRINPSTGKSCNTVFSRPYDLTRHEDTIHARRPKVSCTYCADRGEEKTFSRADALTRHLRVVHPEIEVYGKGGRRRL